MRRSIEKPPPQTSIFSTIMLVLWDVLMSISGAVAVWYLWFSDYAPSEYRVAQVVLSVAVFLSVLGTCVFGHIFSSVKEYGCRHGK